MTTRAWIVGTLLLGSASSAGALACLGEDITPAPETAGVADAGETVEAAAPSCAGQPFTESRAIQIEQTFDLTLTPPPTPFGARALVRPPAPYRGAGVDAGPSLLVGDWKADTATIRGLAAVDVAGRVGSFGIVGLAGDTVLAARETSQTGFNSTLVTARLKGNTLTDIVEQPALNGDSTQVTAPWVVGSPPSAVYFTRSDGPPRAPYLFRSEVSMQSGAPTFGEARPLSVPCPTKSCGQAIAPADERTLFYVAASLKDGSFDQQFDTFEVPLTLGAEITTDAPVAHTELGSALMTWLSPDGCTAIVGELNPATWRLVTRKPR